MKGDMLITKDPPPIKALLKLRASAMLPRAPYMHSGTEKTLRGCRGLYNVGGRTGDPTLDPLIVPLD